MYRISFIRSNVVGVLQVCDLVLQIASTMFKYQFNYKTINMKNYFLVFSLLIGFCITSYGQEIIDFPDPNFKQALLEHTPIIDTDGDEGISKEEALEVTQLDLRNKNISSLAGIEFFTELKILWGASNLLTEIDVSNNLKLTHLDVSFNQLVQIDVSNNLELLSLSARKNQLSIIDLSKNEELVNLDLYFNNFEAINISNNIKLKTISMGQNDLTEIDLSNNIALVNLDLHTNSLNTIALSENTELKTLSLQQNKLSSTDLSQNVLLESLTHGSGNLTQIDISTNINLKRLYIQFSRITQIDVSNNVILEDLYLGHNSSLTGVDVSQNVRLKRIGLQGSPLTELDLSRNGELSYLNVANNRLTSLDVRSSRIEEIFFSDNPNLKEVFMTGQPIGYKLVNGVEEPKIRLKYCPNLEFICADQEYLSDIYELLKGANQSSCLLSSDCDTPHNRIEGNVTYDADGDGCDDEDLPFIGEMRISLLPNGGRAFVAFPNEKGEYAMFVPDGDYSSMFPRLRNNAYYKFATDYRQRDIEIPEDLDTITTDFCVEARDAVNDLEVRIFPLNRARPGFTSSYLITYKNVGTTAQSTTLSLDYQEDVLSYVSSSVAIDTNAGGQIAWDLGVLQPMSTGEITVSFRLNTPTDTPALNNGDILSYTASISAGVDNKPDNNVMTLEQTVVNSYDPNDKTCLEGTILDPDNVGKYLHYLIRFENKGTAEAVNIRVQDVIDTTKLDIETFVPLKGSHSFTTTITNDNKVEFWFNEINLPFDDANNDGYVLFKIKSKDNLVVGDEIVNSAAIYFDFNPPIITEDEIVTVKREVITLPTFEDYFTLSPNPAESFIELTVLDESIKISEIVFYDLYGYEVGYYSGTTRTFDLEHLYPDTYFMHVQTNKGKFTSQFIKL